MRSIWKGALSFGLVSIPVKVYAATQQNDVSFHQVHAEDGGRIRYRRVCELDGEEVPYQDIARGYELPSGDVVVLTDEDFDDLPLPSGKVVDVLQFVPAEQVDPIYFAKSYYLEPDTQGVKPYVLLREALESSDRVAVVKVALRNRESLATLRVRDGVLVLETMLWPDEIREPEFGFLNDDVEIRQQELTMAQSLIESMSDDFDPTQFTDEYRDALEAVVEAKVEGKEVVEVPVAEDRAGEVVDLMAALAASVESAREQRGGGAARGAAKKSASRSTTKPSAPAVKKAAPRKKAAPARASGSTAKRGAPAAKQPRQAPAANRAANSAANRAAKKAAKRTPDKKRKSA